MTAYTAAITSATYFIHSGSLNGRRTFGRCLRSR